MATIIRTPAGKWKAVFHRRGALLPAQEESRGCERGQNIAHADSISNGTSTLGKLPD
jgi:hypothetical protein